MTELYGRTGVEWDQLTDWTVRFLREKARLGLTTNYSELSSTLARRHGARAFDFDLESERAAMGYLLGRAVDVELAVSGLMASAIVLYLNRNDAGPGFFKKAQEVGLLSRRATEPERDRFWQEQVRAVHERYARPARRPR